MITPMKGMVTPFTVTDPLLHPLAPGYLAALRYDGSQLATLRILGEYRGRQQVFVEQLPGILNDLRRIAVIESTESSNRLEGVVVAPARLNSLVIRNARPKSRSERRWISTWQTLWCWYRHPCWISSASALSRTVIAGCRAC